MNRRVLAVLAVAVLGSCSRSTNSPQDASGTGGSGGIGGSGGRAGGPGSGGAAGGAGGSADAGSSAGATGGSSTGGSGATDGGVPPTDGGGPLAWVDRSPCHFPATIPAGRSSPMATFDPDRGKLIAYGGNTDFSDLWEVDVATGLRTDRTTCAYVNVFANWGDALAFDAGRKRVVRFPYSGASNVREWDPVTNVWTNRPAPSGSAVPDGYGRVAVFDTNRALMIVFITTTSGAISVWEWNGTTGGWTQRQASFPTMFSYGLSSLAFDPGRNVLWGFGGVPNSFPISSSDRLWTWNVATTELVDLTPAMRPAAWPVARSGAGLAYDVLRDKVMLYGGSVGSFSRRDFWEWNPAAATWTDLTPSGLSPSGGDTPGIVWPPIDSLGEYHLFADPARGRLVLAAHQQPHGGGTLRRVALGRRALHLVGAEGGHARRPYGRTTSGVSASTTVGRRRWRASSSPRTESSGAGRPPTVSGRPSRWRGGMGAPNSLPQIDGAAIAYDPKARKIVLFGGELVFTGGTPAMLVNDLRLLGSGDVAAVDGVAARGRGVAGAPTRSRDGLRSRAAARVDVRRRQAGGEPRAVGAGHGERDLA